MTVSGAELAAHLRGITRAVRRINTDKRRYISYFIRDWSGHPEVEALRRHAFNLGRFQLKEPGPIPEHEARWAREWMVSCIRRNDPDQPDRRTRGARARRGRPRRVAATRGHAELSKRVGTRPLREPFLAGAADSREGSAKAVGVELPTAILPRAAQVIEWAGSDLVVEAATQTAVPS
jgi:hypothetical protein